MCEIYLGVQCNIPLHPYTCNILLHTCCGTVPIVWRHVDYVCKTWMCVCNYLVACDTCVRVQRDVTCSICVQQSDYVCNNLIMCATIWLCGGMYFMRAICVCMCITIPLYVQPSKYGVATMSRLLKIAENYGSLLQSIVSFVGLFCKRDFWF